MTTMDDAARGTAQKPATAARIYDYFLGGIHNFAADQEAARKVIQLFPDVPAGARANRAFLARAVRYLTDGGIRQFLDIGSGIPTEGNVHEIAQRAAPDSRVVYVDIDPVAVAESLEILDGNSRATAIRGDLRDPEGILDHPVTRELLDFSQPTGLLLAAVLHFLTDDADAYGVVKRLVEALAPGSYLVVSHAAAESFAPSAGKLDAAQDVYRRQTTSSSKLRTRAETERFFAGLELVDPGVVWISEWRSGRGEGAGDAESDRADDPQDPFAAQPQRSSGWAGVARKV